jgi:hypothetical protein
MCSSLSQYIGIDAVASTTPIDMPFMIREALGYYPDFVTERKQIDMWHKKTRASDTICMKALTLLKAVPSPLYGAAISTICYLIQGDSTTALTSGLIATVVAHLLNRSQEMNPSPKTLVVNINDIDYSDYGWDEAIVDRGNNVLKERLRDFTRFVIATHSQHHDPKGFNLGIIALIGHKIFGSLSDKRTYLLNPPYAPCTTEARHLIKNATISEITYFSDLNQTKVLFEESVFLFWLCAKAPSSFTKGRKVEHMEVVETRTLGRRQFWIIRMKIARR